MAQVNIFNAISTIKALVENNEEVISRLTEVETELNRLATNKAIVNFDSNLDWLKKQQEARFEILSYLEEHGNKVIIQQSVWNNWQHILNGNVGNKVIKISDCRPYGCTDTEIVVVELKNYHSFYAIYLTSHF